MKELETFKTTIFIRANNSEYNVAFNSAIPRKWNDLQNLISDDLRTYEVASLMAQKEESKQSASIYLLTKESEIAESYISIFEEIFTPDEFEKIKDVVRYIDLDGLREIASAILQSYSSFYESKLKKQFKE